MIQSFRILLIICFLWGYPLSVSGSKKVPKWLNEIVTKKAHALSISSKVLTIYSTADISYKDPYILLKKRKVQKILKTTGISYGQLIVFSNIRSKKTKIKGWRFDKNGILLEKLKKGYIKERSYNLSFYDDSKQIFASFKNIEKGDIIAFEYNTKNHNYFMDIILPLGNSVDTLYESITVSSDAKVKVLNDPDNLIKKNGFTYSITNLKSTVNESNSPVLIDSLPLIAITFNKTRNTSWDSFGKYFLHQSKHLLKLNNSIKSELSDLFAIKDRVKFIKAVINHVSNSINYVDIEFGKSAYIPRSCDFVHTKKYGDCKDMAFYAIAILREKGIKAYPVLAKTKSSGKVYKDFVCNQFNHMIMAVELEDQWKQLENLTVHNKSYLIADLTDRFTPVPLLNTSLEGSNILILKDTDCFMAEVPFSSAEKNSIRYDINMAFGGDRVLEIKMKETNKGHFIVKKKIFREGLTIQEKKEKYLSWIQNYVPGAIIKDISTKHNNEQITTDINFKVTEAGISSNDQIYLLPNIIDKNTRKFRERTRMNDLVFEKKHTDIVNIAVKISKNYQIIEVPKSIIIDTPYFTGNLSISHIGNTVTYKKKFVWKVVYIKASEYKQLRKKYRKFLKAVKAPIILKKV